ncbi:MAG: CotH kinase family protein [Clostridia bacterium]
MKRMRKIAACILMIVVLLGAMMLGNSVIRSENQVTEEKRETITEKQMKEWEAPDQEFLDYYGIGEFETNLPVVYINTHEQQILKSNKIWGSIALLNADGTEQSVFSVPNSVYSATIKYRGASSYSEFDKKQYRIKFYKLDSHKEANVSLAGMGAHSEWVLNGPYLDKTLMRNKLVYDLAREMNGWAPDSGFVEVFEDGNYRGVYLAVEPVTNGESRLQLSEFGLLSGETAYIVNRDRVDPETADLETYGKLHGYTYNALYLSYPSEKNVTERQKEYILNDLSDFEKALYGEDFNDPKVGYSAYIEVDNWVDYFIINEFAMNYDAGNLSTYAYKDLTGKLQLAVWDFNNAFNNYQWYNLDETGFRTVNNSWMDRICQDRNFIDKVVGRYRQLRESTLSEAHIQELLASYQRELGAAVDRNFKIWGYSFTETLLALDDFGNSRDILSYEQAIAQLETSIHNRLSYLDDNIDRLYDYCID